MRARSRWPAFALSTLCACNIYNVSLPGGGSDTRYAMTVLADAPIGYWRLAEPAGSTAHDELGQHDGTYEGGSTLGVPGVAGGLAVDFNGTDAYVDLGSGFDFEGLAPYTIEAWVKPSADPNSFHHVFTHERRTNGPQDGYALFLYTAGTLGAERAVGGTNVNTADVPFPAGQFVHVATTYDGSDINLFIDGGAGPQKPAPVGLAGTGVDALIGASSKTSGFFHGVITEVAIYDRALTQPQLAAHYAAGSE